jgi:catechol 2,3-dioxygenase-like lactoylglutathione lyase family enzyme
VNIEFHHICIETDDYKESLAFYTKAMGFHILDWHCTVCGIKQLSNSL